MKLRMVLYAYARTNGPSLNDCLYTGPNFGQSILDLPLRSRNHPYSPCWRYGEGLSYGVHCWLQWGVLRFLWTKDVIKAYTVWDSSYAVYMSCLWSLLQPLPIYWMAQLITMWGSSSQLIDDVENALSSASNPSCVWLKWVFKPFNYWWCHLVLSDYSCMLSVGTNRFECRLCDSKKGGTGGHGCTSVRGAVHMALMAAALARCRMETGWTISHPVSTNGHRNHSFPIVGESFLVVQFSVKGTFAGWRTMTIESLLMSGCGQGHEPPKNA